MSTTFDLTAHLEALRDKYTYRVNVLLDEGREELVAQFADDYVEEATRVMAAEGPRD